jgi:hypothetical protein
MRKATESAQGRITEIPQNANEPSPERASISINRHGHEPLFVEGVGRTAHAFLVIWALLTIFRQAKIAG